MKYRKLTITIDSANNLPNVRIWGRMRVYAVVSCNGVSYMTKIDMDHKRHPRWKENFVFLIDEASVQKPGTRVAVRLYCKRTFRRDKPVGDEVAIEVKSLYDKGVRAEKSVTYPVPQAQGGTLNILYNFGAPKQRWFANWQKIFSCGFFVCCEVLPIVIECL